jgi:hypothetical protein
MNINFDPAWMSGKNIRCTVPSFSNYWLRLTWLTCCVCVPEYNNVYFDPLPLKRQESSENRSCDVWKTFWKTLHLRDFDICPVWLPCVIFFSRTRVVQVLHRATCVQCISLHHGRNWAPMGCHLRHRIPNDFVFSCWWRLKYQEILQLCRSLSMSGFQSLALFVYVHCMYVCIYVCLSVCERVVCVCMCAF